MMGWKVYTHIYTHIYVYNIQTILYLHTYMQYMHRYTIYIHILCVYIYTYIYPYLSSSLTSLSRYISGDSANIATLLIVPKSV